MFLKKEKSIIQRKRMKEDFSDKKILGYSIFIYLFLLLAEFSFNIFSFISNYSKGKVSSTFFSKINEVMGLLKFDIVLYILTLVIIYLIFSVINYFYVVLAYQEVSSRKSIPSSQLKACLLIGINVYFILSLLFYNAVHYPFSNITKFGSLFVGRNNYQVLKVFAYIFIIIYFIGFFYLSFKHAKKKVKIPIWVFLGLVLLANFNPYFYVKNLYYSLHSKKNSGPNVIIIGLDSLNPKHTGYCGYEPDTTPFLDNLLKEYIVFENAHTPLARTFPSWFSILTGQNPVTNGARYNLIKRKFINTESETLPNILKKQDYFTAYFTDEARFSNILKEDGYQYLRHPIMGVKDFVLANFHDFSMTNVFFNSPLGYKIFNFTDINRAVYYLYKNRYFTDDLISFLSFLKTKEKFFLAVHFCAPHWPYMSSAPYPYLYQNLSSPLFEQYDGALRMGDDQLKRLITSLKKKGLYENSIIIVLSDHGETIEGHGTDLKMSDQNRILLSFKQPKSRVHFDVNTLVSTIDIFPTVLDLLNFNSGNYKNEGSSLEPALTGNEKEMDADRFIIMETGFSVDIPGGIGISFQEMIEEGMHFYEFDKRGIITVKEKFHQELIKRKQRAVQTGKWELILTPLVRRNENRINISLYDLENDPDCKQDVSEKYPDVYGKLLKILMHNYKDELTEDYIRRHLKKTP
jgi:arylsulfatase A-like enzyme